MTTKNLFRKIFIKYSVIFWNCVAIKNKYQVCLGQSFLYVVVILLIKEVNHLNHNKIKLHFIAIQQSKEKRFLSVLRSGGIYKGFRIKWHTSITRLKLWGTLFWLYNEASISRLYELSITNLYAFQEIECFSFKINNNH